MLCSIFFFFFFFQAEDGIRDLTVTGVQTCALPISFCNQNAWWLEDFVLYDVLKQHHGGGRWGSGEGRGGEKGRNRGGAGHLKKKKKKKCRGSKERKKKRSIDNNK